MNQKKIIFIVGPTASGKSNVALELALKIKGEIVSSDAMQVYKEINIISNKPTKEDQKQVPHHLINIVSIEDKFDVVKFNKLAIEAIDKIHKKDKVPIVVGGSGLYMQILLDGIFEGGKKDEALREHFRQQAAEKGNDYVYGLLTKEDKKAAEKIHPNDLKKVIRALEVAMVEKRPITEMQKEREGIWRKYDISIFALDVIREKLYEKINNRVDIMIEQGAIDEVKKLRKKEINYTAAGIIGIKEIQGYLDGEYDIDRLKYLMKLNTRHYAKRQLTWFRRDKRIKWIKVDNKLDAKLIAGKILCQK
ncbi:MAG: tRNA (adenosine(37)-N6)-dimethylallyltransferase MiaA [Candidatus Zapsychrus exili]|nr:tRNA (adenosine(37)-N6)-dimethylallyltransferase MiaA [Candidatus Zapsychrus exili]